MCVHLFLKSINDSILYTLFLQSFLNIHTHANFFSLRLYLGDGGGDLVTQSRPTLAIPWTVACQAPLYLGFSRQEYWSRLPFRSPGDIPNPGTNLGLLNCRQILYRLSHEGSPILGLVSCSVQFSSVAQPCPTLCDPMNRSMPSLPVHHQLLEFTWNINL